MKELSIEEKAKAYDEAIKKAESLYKVSEPMSGCNVILETIFPELTESEDERIRKEIISAVNIYCSEYSRGTKVREDMLAWLEKQSQTFTKKDVDDAYLKGVTNTKNEIEKQYEANYQIRKDIATFIFNYRGDIKDRAKWMDYLGIKVSFVEKQGEQNPADKIEPKFKVGNTIVKNNSDINRLDLFTITDITGGKYWYNDRIICDIAEQNEWTLFDVIY